MSNKAWYLRKNLTDAEKKLWANIRKRQINGLKFRRQQPIGNYIVDFVCYEKKIIIKIDGGQHIENENFDLKRSKWLEGQGFEVLRFWNNEVLENTQEVLDFICKETVESPPP